jgi:Zn-dependent peptidase ImmA (M78 family)
MGNEVNINTDMLTWAIDRAGHDLDEFTVVFPKLKEWLENKNKPTFNQLQSFSKKVHVPLGYLFLQKPPVEQLPIPYFRSGKNNKKKVSINIFDTVLLLKNRQEWLREYLQENEFDKKKFVGKFHNVFNPEKIVSDIRATLGLTENWAGKFPTWEQTLEHLTEKIEEAGIIIIFNSVVENNTHRPIDVKECRGFVLSDEYAPFMFINAADAKAAQMFTIVHELAHIWTGNSAGFDFRQMQPADDPIEQMCDKVAAEFLVPENLFLELWDKNKNFKQLAKIFKVSPIVIARRALDLDKITKGQFFSFYNNYMDGLKEINQKKSGGGDFYRTAKKRVGLTYAAHINQAVKSGQLLYRDAYKLTGLKGDTYQKFLNQYFN